MIVTAYEFSMHAHDAIMTPEAMMFMGYTRPQSRARWYTTLDEQRKDTGSVQYLRGCMAAGSPCAVLDETSELNWRLYVKCRLRRDPFDSDLDEQCHGGGVYAVVAAHSWTFLHVEGTVQQKHQDSRSHGPPYRDVFFNTFSSMVVAR